MHRKDFLKSCGYACMGLTIAGGLFDSCTSTRILTGTISGDYLVIKLKYFETGKKKDPGYKKYLVVQHEILKYPICVYRFSSSEFSALWMQCTHQGTELQVFGEKLQCPAHGSEFDHHGAVTTGPADSKLRSFPVTIESDQLKISLKAI